jgi:hypothetical protein
MLLNSFKGNFLASHLTFCCIHIESEVVNCLDVVPCRLYIKQASSNTSVSGDDNDVEWAEYKIKETNMFTVDKYQQVRLFSIAGKLERKP